MEVQDEVMVMGSKDQSHILKGKRTKRQRPISPFVLTMATTSSCSSADGSGGCGVAGGFGDLNRYSSSGADRLTTSPSNSGEFIQTTVDEEDMANCLILLAQGRSQKSSESALATTNKAGVDVYQCKTCNRCFPSFQALGGHRASHNKPKVTLEEKKSLAMMAQQENVQFNDDNTTLSLQIPSRDSCSPNNKSRVHECSICGSGFTSGQALGGHMRRHRQMPMVTSSHEVSQEVKKRRTILSLDLNLPAPEDDHRESKFSFASKEQVIVFSASALVDCPY